MQFRHTISTLMHFSDPHHHHYHQLETSGEIERNIFNTVVVSLFVTPIKTSVVGYSSPPNSTLRSLPLYRNGGVGSRENEKQVHFFFLKRK